MKKDRLHPEKKKRPLASGEVRIWQAVILAIIVFAAGTFVATLVSKYMIYMTSALFILTQLYTFWLKNVAFADVLMISVNFVIRVISGLFVINAKSSPWLVLCPFFLALFLAVAKRDANVRMLKKDATKFRPILKFYTLEITNALMLITTTCLIISYALYAFLNQERISLLMTLPFALYIIFRYFFLVYSGSEIPADPHKAIKDYRLVIGGALWALSTFLLLYFSDFIGGMIL